MPHSLAPAATPFPPAFLERFPVARGLVRVASDVDLVVAAFERWFGARGGWGWHRLPCTLCKARTSTMHAMLLEPVCSVCAVGRYPLIGQSAASSFYGLSNWPNSSRCARS